MIKVSQLIPNPYKIKNPFVYALMDGIDELYDDIKWGWGYNCFWTDRIYKYDIVLVHWPNELLVSGSNKIHSIDEIKSRILSIKARGIKIISFVHNLEPHYCTDITRIECYRVLYSLADTLIHMGEYSRQILTEKYPHVKHINIGTHYIYDKVYKYRYTREQGCVTIGRNQNYRYVLAFGAFRNDEECELVRNLAHDLNKYDKRIMVLAPSYSDLPISKSPIEFGPYLRRFMLKHRNHIICNGGSSNIVPDSLLPYYYAAADVCVIHRKKILNSGNVPMAYLMGKVVAGPDVGNVGEILSEMGNPTFDANDRKSVFDSVLKAISLAKNGKGEWNHEYAMNHFSTEIFCRKLHDIIIESLQ